MEISSDIYKISALITCGIFLIICLFAYNCTDSNDDINENTAQLLQDEPVKIDPVEKYISTIQGDSVQIFDFDYKEHLTENNSDIVYITRFYNNMAKDLTQTVNFEIPNNITLLIKQLKKKLIKLQISSYPAMREKFAENMANEMWEHDIYISVSGSGYAYLNITGGIFASNSNTQDTQTLINEPVYLLRFKQTRYRWYKYAEEYTSYTMNAPKDNELITN